MPWLHEKRREQEGHLDCKTCRKSVTPEIRQFLACGYEPRVEKAQPWRPNGIDEDMEISTCAGYTSQLPTVSEAMRAYLHWEKGQLQLREPDPPAALIGGIEVLALEVGAVQAHKLKPVNRG